MALTKTPIELSSTPGIVDNSNATAITIDSSENVGIKETAPFGKLHISDTQTGRTVADSVGNLLVLEDDENGMSILSSNAGAGYILFGDAASAASGGIVYDHSANKFNFRTNDAWNRMILDASGNLLVGKTSSSVSSSGLTVIANDFMSYTNTSTDSGDRCLVLNRQNGSGNILDFKQANGLVGSIGTQGGRLSIGSGDVNLNFNASANSIYPISDAAAGTLSDGVVDIGASTARFKDLYIAGLNVTYSTYNKISSYFSGSYTSGFKFSDLNGGIWYDAATDDLTVSASHANSQLILESGGSEAMRIDASGSLLVGTTTSGTKTGDGVIAFGSVGGVMNNFNASVAHNGTLDIAINTGGGGYQGFLSVANTVAANAAVRTQSTFSVFGRSTDSSIQQIATDTGTTGAATFTVTTPSNGVIRVTNTSGTTTIVSMQFFGGASG
jgi:hypothetical protein